MMSFKLGWLIFLGFSAAQAELDPQTVAMDYSLNQQGLWKNQGEGLFSEDTKKKILQGGMGAVTALGAVAGAWAETKRQNFWGRLPAESYPGKSMAKGQNAVQKRNWIGRDAAAALGAISAAGLAHLGLRILSHYKPQKHPQDAPASQKPWMQAVDFKSLAEQKAETPWEEAQEKLRAPAWIAQARSLPNFGDPRLLERLRKKIPVDTSLGAATGQGASSIMWEFVP